jgi:hypothetical protein
MKFKARKINDRTGGEGGIPLRSVQKARKFEFLVALPAIEIDLSLESCSPRVIGMSSSFAE